MSRDGVWAGPSVTFETVSTNIVQPATASAAEQRTALSVSDANKTGWGQAAGVWFFSAPPGGSFADEATQTHLRTSLAHTLDAYRPWCGQLRMRPYSQDATSKRILGYGRLELVNGPADPGVLFIVAKRPGALPGLVPSLEERRTTHTRWDALALDNEAWFPEQAVANPLGQADSRSDADHSVIVKLTILDDGAAALAIKVSHACADAHSLARFAKDWSAVSRALVQKTVVPTPTPRFEAQRVDGTAGDIVRPAIDGAKATMAKALPVRRFDSWISLPGQVPPEFEGEPTAKDPAGDQMPLAEMGMASPKSHYIVHFRPEQVQQLYEAASKGGAAKISRQDALVAHIWSRINAARGLQKDDSPAFCNYMLGFRSRLSPPLGDDFMGSPFAVVSAEAKASETCGADGLARSAAAIAQTTRQFTPATIGPLMHLWAYESSPTRVWGHMFGTHHLMVTSWVREGVNDVDFGLGGLRFSRMNLPSIDGLLQLVEAGSDGKGGERWDRFGVDASICLAEDVMAKVLQDPLLLPQ